MQSRWEPLLCASAIPSEKAENFPERAENGQRHPHVGSIIRAEAVSADHPQARRFALPHTFVQHACADLCTARAFIAMRDASSQRVITNPGVRFETVHVLRQEHGDASHAGIDCASCVCFCSSRSTSFLMVRLFRKSNQVPSACVACVV